MNNSNNPRSNWYQLLVINGTNRGKLSFKLLLLDKIIFFCDNVSILWPCIPAVIEKKVWTAMLIRAWCWLPQYSEFWCSASETEVGTECPSVECVCAAPDVTFTNRSWSILTSIYKHRNTTFGKGLLKVPSQIKNGFLTVGFQTFFLTKMKCLNH